jgi:membrane protein required for beta-lactamase induction
VVFTLPLLAVAVLAAFGQNIDMDVPRWLAVIPIGVLVLWIPARDVYREYEAVAERAQRADESEQRAELLQQQVTDLQRM